MKKGKALEQFLSAENYNYRVVVHCRTKLEARSFLKFLHKLGYSWCSSDSLLKVDNYEEYREDTCYALGYRMKNTKNCVEYCDIGYFTRVHESTVIDFCQIANFL